MAPGQDDIELLSVATTDNESPKSVLENGAEGILGILNVRIVAVSTFSSEEKARLWLVTHAPELGCAPLALLASKSGQEKVLGVLRRIEQNDFSGQEDAPSM